MSVCTLAMEERSKYTDLLSILLTIAEKFDLIPRYLQRISGQS